MTLLDILLAQDGSGTRLLSPDELKDISRLAASKSMLVHTVESFEIDGQHHIPHIDLGIFGRSADSVGMTWSDKIIVGLGDIEDMLVCAAREPNPIRFKVWFDTE